VKSWRVKYQRPDGTWAPKSGFKTKAAALKYGRDQETDVGRGVWIDPRKSATPTGDWIATWLDAQDDYADTTMYRVRYYLDTYILPQWSDTALGAHTKFAVRTWARGLKCAPSTVQQVVSLLSTILSAAADAGLTAANPLYRVKLNLTAKTPPRVWVLPEMSLPVATRCRRPANLLILTAAFCGMRWGELAGLVKSNCCVVRWDVIDGGKVKRYVICIDPDVGALKEVSVPDGKGVDRLRMYLGPPKPPNGAREVDVPAFLAELLLAHMATWPFDKVFSGQRGKWLRRSNFATRVMRPAADGREARPTVRGHAAAPGWDAVAPGLETHGLRHGHKTAMIEDDVPEVLQKEQLGHEYGGVDGVYSHVTGLMRKRRLDALQARWDTAVAARPELLEMIWATLA